MGIHVQSAPIIRPNCRSAEFVSMEIFDHLMKYDNIILTRNLHAQIANECRF